MKAWARALVLLLFVLAGAVLGLPASWVEWPIAHAANGMWRLSAPEGSLWQGQGQWMFVSQEGAVLPMSRVQWSLQLAELLSGRVVWQLRSDGATGRVEWSLSGWKLDGVGFSLPMAALARLLPPWQAAGFSGQLVVRANDFGKQAGQYSGTMRVEWRGAASRLVQVAPLGTYALDVAGTGEGVALHMGTLSGDLMVEGNGGWQPGNTLSLAGTARSTPERYEALKPLLLMLGQLDGSATVRWRLKSAT